MIILSTKPIFKVAFHSSTSISNEKIGSFCTPKPVSITEVVWSHYTHIFWELGGLVALHSWTLRRWGGNEARSRYTQVLIYLFIFLIYHQVSYGELYIGHRRPGGRVALSLIHVIRSLMMTVHQPQKARRQGRTEPLHVIRSLTVNVQQA